MNKSEIDSDLKRYAELNKCSIADAYNKGISLLPTATKESFKNIPRDVQGWAALVLAGEITKSHPVIMEEIIEQYDKTVFKDVWYCWDKGDFLRLEKDETLSTIYVDSTTKMLQIYSLEEDIPTLTIDHNDSMQPAIGSRTNTGMSYGRWSPGHLVEFKIVIDHVHVIINSVNETFTLGTYNYDFIPEVECRNGGSLECPEMHGKRYLMKEARPPQGSTKIRVSPVYKIGEEFTDEQLMLKDNIARLNPELANSLTHLTDAATMRAFQEILARYPGVDLLKYKDVKNVRRNSVDCMILGFDDVDCDDVFYQTMLYNKLLKMYTENCNINERSSAVQAVFSVIKNHIKPDCIQYTELLYTLIPPYDFVFSGKPHEECIDEYAEGALPQFIENVSEKEVLKFLKILPEICVI